MFKRPISNVAVNPTPEKVMKTTEGISNLRKEESKSIIEAPQIGNIPNTGEAATDSSDSERTPQKETP